MTARSAPFLECMEFQSLYGKFLISITPETTVPLGMALLLLLPHLSGEHESVYNEPRLPLHHSSHSRAVCPLP